MKSIIRIAACTSVCLAAVIQSAAVSAAEQNGWETVGRRRYYYENGEALTGEQVIDGIPYLFAPNGVQQTGWQTTVKEFIKDDNGRLSAVNAISTTVTEMHSSACSHGAAKPIMLHGKKVN